MRTPLALFSGTAVNTISITTDQIALNLKTLYELSYPPAVGGDIITFNADAALIFSSSTPSTPSLDAPAAIRTGVWAVGVDLRLNIASCTVTGAGGSGTGPSAAAGGGVAFYAESAIAISASGSTFSGGGGGGAGTDSWPSPNSPYNNYASGGGGGAGRPPGDGGVATADVTNNGAGGTFTGGGVSGTFGSDPDSPGLFAEAGDGGALGAAGQDAGDVAQPGSTDNVGGNGGYSVSGIGLVTWVIAPTLTGSTS